MHRSWIPASLSCVPDVHSVFGYPFFSTGAVSVFLSRYLPLHLQILEHDPHLHGFLPHILQSHLQSFYPVLCSDVSYMPIFPVSAQSHVPSGICGSVPVCGTSGLFTGMIYESSSQDSSVCPHDGTDCIGIDPQIHTADDLFFYRCFRQVLLLLYRKNAENTCGVSFQSQGLMFFPFQFLRDIPYRYVLNIHGTISSHARRTVSDMLHLSFCSFTVHHIPVKDRHGMVPAGKFRPSGQHSVSFLPSRSHTKIHFQAHAGSRTCWR